MKCENPGCSRPIFKGESYARTGKGRFSHYFHMRCYKDLRRVQRQRATGKGGMVSLGGLW